MVRLEREARAAVRRARAVARRWQGPGSGPKVSVVLAVRGAARHLPECLDSVLASTHRALEVLLVAEPGDAAAQWALEWLPRGRRVRRVQPVGEQAWLDAAVAAARGDFVCFVDADDLVPAEGFAQLVRLLTDTGADLAVGSRQTARAGAERFPPWQERLLKKHDARRLGSQTVRSCPEVLVDLTLTGKMFRRDHWGRAGLSVPGWHEGAATVAAAYLGARAVALTPAFVYEEQARDVSAPVEEQARFDPEVARERLDGLVRASRTVAEQQPALLERWVVDVLTQLLPPMYLDAVGGGPGYVAHLAPAVDALLRLVSRDRLADVPLEPRLAAWVAAHGSLEDLALLEDHFADNPDGLPTCSEDTDRQVAELPAGLGVEPPPEATRVEDVDRPLRVRLGDLVRDGDRLCLEGAAFAAYDERDDLPTLVLTRPGTKPRVLLGVERRTDPRLNLWARRAWEDRSGSGFTAWLPADALPGPAGARFHVEVSMAGHRDTLVVSGPDAGTVDEPPGLVIGEVAVTGDLLRVTATAPVAPARARLDGGRGRTDAVPLRTDGLGFAAEIPMRTTLFGADVHLPTGRYRLELEDRAGRPVAARWSERLLREAPDLVGDRVAVALDHEDGGAVVQLSAPLSKPDRSAYGQQRLRSLLYAAPAGTPYDSMVLLETFRGRSVGDSPGAVGRELAARDLGLDLVWVTDDPSVRPPAGTRGVVRRTREWYDALAGARAYVANAGAPYWFTKKPGQVHLQTWHGTPLKKIGEDRGPGDFSTWRHRRRIAAQAAGWDGLVSPSRFCSPIFRSAFRYGGPMLEVGYPRNDLLASAEAPAVRDRVRTVLGLRPEQRVVLYAPTWREYVGVRDAKPLYLDAEALTRRMPDAVVLVRGHYNSTTQRDVFVGHPRIHDVTRYPDIADLYLAADVLVTDYSSVMFDFTLTDKPVVLLTPDLEQYRDVERGFYFDIEQRAPGPLVTSTGDVVDVLQGPDAYAAARASFRAEFCPWDDGHASARAVDWLLEQL